MATATSTNTTTAIITATVSTITAVHEVKRVCLRRLSLLTKRPDMSYVVKAI